MKTVIVAVSGFEWVIVFKRGDDIVRTESFRLWRDASREIIAWVEFLR